MKRLKSALNSPFKKIVIWGLRRQFHTHRYIHASFYKVLHRLGVRVHWVDDRPDNARAVESGDLVISVGFAAKRLPVIEGAYYCLHNFDDSFTNRIPERNRIRLQVYTNDCSKVPAAVKWMPATYFDNESQTLYQPWGTDLLAEDFRRPVHRQTIKISFWIGSIWNNEANQGNLEEIDKLRKVLSSHACKFIALRRIPDWLNVALVRASVVAPAIGGKWQAANGYLPCRMFKNISYGQIGIANIPAFASILGDAPTIGESIEQIVEAGLSMSSSQRQELTIQQQAVVKEHTYLQKLRNVFRAFEIVRNN